ncbi:MAG TPA: hypothetical protein VG845_01475 [Dehalococcoidia bacterium]|jgi:hypothetical protein|nr:hypothetical protein [Dehalococcoidia bacterium]
MNFETAVQVSTQVERSFPSLTVGGFRRLSREREDSWAVDIVQPDSGRMVTLDEKDDWDRILKVNFPELQRSR